MDREDFLNLIDTCLHSFAIEESYLFEPDNPLVSDEKKI